MRRVGSTLRIRQAGVRPARAWNLLIWVCAFCPLLFALPVRAQPDSAAAVERQVQRIDSLLSRWQFVEAEALAVELLREHPDLPAVQLAAGWVKFHLGEHASAAALIDRASAAFGPRLERDSRVGMVRAMARISADFVRSTSADGRVEVFHAPGVDKVLVPDLIDTVQRTLTVVGKDLGHVPTHKIVVQVLPDARALADATGLTNDEIRTSGTIAVCKFGRLMITSPRTTLKGYSYLDTASHELVHLIISEKTHNRTPIWLHEALAKYEDTRWRAEEPLYRLGLSPRRQSNLAKALASDALITFEQMHPSMALLPSQEAADLAFSEVYTVTAFLLERKGYQGLRELLEQLARGVQDIDAIEAIYGLSKSRFERTWTDWLLRQKLVRLRGGDLNERESEGRTASGERSLTRVERVDLRDNFHLGQLLRARGKQSASLVEYKKAHERAGPGHAALWVIADKLGQVFSALGRKSEAARVFRESLEVNPSGIEAHLHLGRLLIEDDPWFAYLHLREANRQNPIDPRPHLGLMKVCSKLADAGDKRLDFAALADHHRLAFRVIRLIRPQRPGLAHSADADRAPVISQATAEPVAARLRVITRPWARVWLDNKDTGLTSPVYELPLSPGRHVVGLAADCLAEPVVLVIDVKAGQVQVIDRDLCPAPPAGKAIAK
jgi:tetratricopeptide (TPR) repeat protein